MHSFKNDYGEGAHPRILQALAETCLESNETYGADVYTIHAAELIKRKFNCDHAAVHFFTGGTQTNLTAISAFLRPHEAVIAAHTGHILVHETGAIEATGHKIIAVESGDGKLRPQQLRSALESHSDEHMVKPRLVYISNTSELGSVYTKKELKQVSDFCRSNQLLLFMDGARLGSALCAAENDLELEDLAGLCDAFYIGGTKNGALLGEALVICNKTLQTDFRFHMKQKGALLAKGSILGIQFLELFRDDLYFELARHANQMADRLASAIGALGYRFLTHSPSNQIFPILPDRIIAKLAATYAFYVWSKIDESHSVIRLVTSWATREEAVGAFLTDLERLTETAER